MRTDDLEVDLDSCKASVMDRRDGKQRWKESSLRGMTASEQEFT